MPEGHTPGNQCKVAAQNPNPSQDSAQKSIGHGERTGNGHWKNRGYNKVCTYLDYPTEAY